MTDFRPAFLRSATALLAFLIAAPPGSAAAKRDDAPASAAALAADPAFFAMLGASVPSGRVVALSKSLRAASLPGETAAADLPIFAVMRDAGSAGSPSYEASDVALEIVTEKYGKVRIEHARLVLTPSNDGHSCRFELSGAPFAATTSLAISGNIEWATGPFGGDKLDVTFRLDHAPVDAVRAAFPERIDPSFRGVLDVHGKGSGVVGEATTEDAPATPLRGDLEATLDWQILGRTSPLAVTSAFALDDRMVRLRDGHLKWQGFDMALLGWVDPQTKGQYDLNASVAGVDTYKAASEWDVPPAWRPVATLSGTIKFAGTPGTGMLRYEARAPSVEVPALGGYTIRVTAPKLQGSLLAVNADVSMSMRPEKLRIGDLDLGPLPVGVQWWRDSLSASTSNTTLWGGKNDGQASYKPANHPEFAVSGRLASAEAPAMVAALAPWVGVDVAGAAALSYSLGQDATRTPLWSAHASLSAGRLGGIDLFARVLEALGAADPALRVADAAAMAPKPRQGKGTRVDRWFFEIARSGEDFTLGAMLLRGGDFQLDADGNFSRTKGLRLQGTVAIPEAVVAKLAASAPWFSSLGVAGTGAFVPVMITGTPAAPKLELDPSFVELLARAKRGEAVTATGAREVKHVGADNLATIPGDPAALPE